LLGACDRYRMSNKSKDNVKSEESKDGVRDDEGVGLVFSRHHRQRAV
jgi:hypothetical protein